ncbi:MAG: peptidylprolyl isomerase [Alphaproteobacteria bacterium]|nr:peptidylprolyl isomerase [Alphaproteobacteria bacterium]MCB9928125.1 peptidylprolyl isomerase [Alphaproteobacteria bacterium]
MTQATTGHTVHVHYRGTLDDGTEFDNSAGREPLQVTLGQGQVIPGFENALMGMSEGESKTVTLPPEEAYGEANPGLVHEVDRAQIPAEIPLQLGMTLTATNQQGGQMQLTVIAMEDDKVTLDANHPLAGKALTFELTLAKIAA